MSFIELLLIAIGLSMDAFAAAVCVGLPMTKVRMRDSIKVGLYFGVAQALMPLGGYYIASLSTEYVKTFDHWVAFVLLSVIGGKMIYESFKKDGAKVDNDALKPKKMLTLALATSIDALITGVTFAFLEVKILPAVSLIGVTTFLLSALGVSIGRLFGFKLKNKAELIGGAVLVLIGVKTLLNHLGFLSF